MIGLAIAAVTAAIWAGLVRWASRDFHRVVQVAVADTPEPEPLGKWDTALLFAIAFLVVFYGLAG